jgi:hypothetical protein
MHVCFFYGDGSSSVTCNYCILKDNNVAVFFRGNGAATNKYFINDCWFDVTPVFSGCSWTTPGLKNNPSFASLSICSYQSGTRESTGCTLIRVCPTSEFTVSANIQSSRNLLSSEPFKSSSELSLTPAFSSSIKYSGSKGLSFTEDWKNLSSRLSLTERFVTTGELELTLEEWLKIDETFYETIWIEQSAVVFNRSRMFNESDQFRSSKPPTPQFDSTALGSETKKFSTSNELSLSRKWGVLDKSREFEITGLSYEQILSDSLLVTPQLPILLSPSIPSASKESSKSTSLLSPTSLSVTAEWSALSSLYFPYEPPLAVAQSTKKSILWYVLGISIGMVLFVCLYVRLILLESKQKERPEPK